MSLPGQDNYIFSNIRRCNRNLLFVNGIILLIIISTGFYQIRYLYNFFFGPFDTDGKTLISIKEPDKVEKYFCTITGEEVYDSGVQHVVTNVDKYTNKVTGERIEAYYYILVVNKRYLIVKSPDRERNHSYSGAIVKIPADVKNTILDQVKEQETKAYFLPFMMDATNFRTNGYWYFGITLPILLIVLWNLIKFVQRNNCHEEHPVYKRLGKYGVASDIASRINDEIIAQSLITGSIKTTPSWLLIERFFTLDIENLADIIWVYKKITTHKAYGVITTGQTFELCIMTRDGKAIYTTGKEIQIDEIIRNICNKAPWVIAGFSAEIKNLWDRQRNTFIATVDQKREETFKTRKNPSEN